MSKTFSKFALTAGLVLAMALTFSCSSDDDGGGGGDNGGGGNGGSYGDKGNDIGNYRTVVIGTQTWMAENLNYAVEGSKCYGEGGEVAIGEDENFSLTTLSNAEVQANCDKYGRLYDWATAMALPPSCNENSCHEQTQEIQEPHQGICPSGWHIPSRVDWRILGEYVDNSGAKLKATSGWVENDGTDEFGFSALPGGYAMPGGIFSVPNEVFGSVGINGYWWSATEHSQYSELARFLFIRIMPMFEDMDDPRAYDMDDPRTHKSLMQSVRCLKDN